MSSGRMRRPPLRALAVFEAAARHMSFQFAAKEMNLTPSAVSHHIKSLELHLGHPLFLRMNRALRLTSAGAKYQTFVREALDKIDLGTTNFLREQPIGERLFVRAGSSFTQKWLLPRLPMFLADNPHIDLLIDTRGPGGFFETEDVDIEIRYGHSDVAGLRIEPLQAERIQPLCSPALLRGSGRLRDPRDLARHTLIESVGSQVTWSKWFAEFKDIHINPPGLRFDRSSLALQAAVYGLGVALEGDFLASEELASGRLVYPMSPRRGAIRTPLRFLMIPETKFKRAGVQAFRQWLLREMGI